MCGGSEGRMTCFEKYILEHKLPVVGYPYEYGYMPERPANCYSISCFKDCWAKTLVIDDEKEEIK